MSGLNITVSSFYLVPVEMQLTRTGTVKVLADSPEMATEMVRWQARKDLIEKDDIVWDEIHKVDGTLKVTGTPVQKG